jgi:hypothetical protein
MMNILDISLNDLESINMMIDKLLYNNFQTSVTTATPEQIEKVMIIIKGLL